MSFRDGYQGDANLNELTLTGDLPADHTIGGFGLATVLTATIFSLNLLPAISGYRPGLLLDVKFPVTNTGEMNLDVNSLGPKPIKKFINGTLVNLEANDLSPDAVYQLMYDGDFFLVTNSCYFLRQATESTKGISQIVTNAELLLGENDSKYITSLKLKMYLATWLKPIRTQISFYSDSVAEDQYSGAPVAIANSATIIVAGIPATATIRQATLIWESTIRNSSELNNSFLSGKIVLASGETTFEYLNLVGALRLDGSQNTQFSFVVHDVSNIVHGNGNYTASIRNASTQLNSIFMAGHWSLEIDYEYPVVS